jgi:hypothetical protein
MIDVQRLRRWLEKRTSETEIPDIVPLIVFVREGVELDVAKTPVPVLRQKQLKKTVRQIEKQCQQPLDETSLYELERAMLGDKIDEL